MPYLHASLNELPLGTVLKPQETYTWSNTTFYQILEKYRPKDMLAHHQSVFMCDDIEDLDNCMEGIYLFVVEPHGRIQRHDMNWSTEISILEDTGASDEELEKIAEKYWQGQPSEMPLWEYLCEKAVILEVHPYDEYEMPVTKKLKY